MRLADEGLAIEEAARIAKVHRGSPYRGPRPPQKKGAKKSLTGRK